MIYAIFLLCKSMLHTRKTCLKWNISYFFNSIFYFKSSGFFMTYINEWFLTQHTLQKKSQNTLSCQYTRLNFFQNSTFSCLVNKCPSPIFISNWVPQIPYLALLLYYFQFHFGFYGCKKFIAQTLSKSLLDRLFFTLWLEKLVLGPGEVWTTYSLSPMMRMQSELWLVGSWKSGSTPEKNSPHLSSFQQFLKVIYSHDSC